MNILRFLITRGKNIFILLRGMKKIDVTVAKIEYLM